MSTLKSQAGQPSGARKAARFRLALATTQIALSMLLLAASGFFVKSLLNVSRVDLGIKTDNMITFRVSPVLNGYTPERSRVFFQQLEEQLAATPGVTATTASTTPILAGSNKGNDVAVQGFEAGPDTDTNSRVNQVGPGYFAAMGVPLIAGREFTRGRHPGVAEGRDRQRGVRQEVQAGSGRGRQDDRRRPRLPEPARHRDRRRRRGTRSTARSSGRSRRSSSGRTGRMPTIGSISFYVRTAGDPAQMASAVTAVVKRLDPNLPVTQLKTLSQQVRDNTFLDHMMTTLSSLFAGLATLLAAVGLYGVLAYTVSQRTREIGLRMALGAAPGSVRAMVLRQVAWMTLVGGIIGLAGAVGVGYSAGSILFELKAWDPAVLAISAVLLTMVAIGARASSRRIARRGWTR